MAAKIRSNYLSNVLKSIKYASIDTVAELNPVIVEFHKTNKGFVRDTIDEIREKTEKSLGVETGGFNFKGFAKESYSNLREDLRTGQFYNKQRSDAANEEAMSILMDMDMSEFGDFGDDFDENDEFEENDNEESYDEVAESVSAAVSPLVAAATRVSVTGISESVISANMKTTSALGGILVQNSNINSKMIYGTTKNIMAGINMSTAMMHQDLTAMNNNIASMVTFIDEGLRTHIENSTTFFETQKNQMQEQTDLLREIVQNQQKALPKESDNYRTSIRDIFGENGSIDLSAYKDYLSQNKLGGGGTLGMVMEFLPALVADFKGSPLKGLTKYAVKKAIPNTMKDMFADVNDMLAGAMATGMVNLSQARTGKYGNVLKTLGETFGLKIPELSKMDTKNYEKGITSWTGIDHKALTQVIPKYLADIYSAISGTPTTRYDYATGKFVTIDKIRKKYKEEERDAIENANFDINYELEERLDKIDFANKEQKKMILDAIDKIQEYNFKHMKNFNPNSKRKEDLDPKTYGITGPNADEIMQIVRMLYSTIDKKTQLQASRELLESVSSYNEDLRDREASGDNIFNALFDDSVDESKIIYTPIMASARRLDQTNWLLNNIYDAITHGNTINETVYNAQLNANKNVPGSTIWVPDTPQRKTGTANNTSENNKDRKPFKFGDDLSNLEEMFLADDEIDESVDDKEEEIKYTDKIKNAQTASDKLKEFFKGFSLLSHKPLTFMKGAIDKVDEYTYSLFFGEGEEDVKSVSGKIIKGFDNVFKSITGKVHDTFKAVKDTIAEEGKATFSGIFKAIFGIDLKQFKSDLKEGLFGGEDVSFLKGFGKLVGSGVKEIASDVTSPIKGLFNKGDKEDKIPNAAKGLKVSKTGLVAVSAGERIIPNSMDPASIAGRENAEKTAIGKFKNKLGLGEVEIANFATGGIVGEKRYNPNMTYEQFNAFYETLESDEDKEKYLAMFAKDFASRKTREIVDKGVKDKDQVIAKVKRISNQIAKKNPVLADAIDKEASKITESDFVKNVKSNTKKVWGTAVQYGKDVKDKAQEVYDTTKEYFTREDEFNAAFKDLLKRFTPDKGNAKEIVEDISKNWVQYLPKTLGGGALGAGLAFATGMVGGPLLGAAIGSSVALTAKSKALQKVLFGEEVTDENGNVHYKRGVLEKDISDAIKKYAPDMSKGGILGMATSMLPFIPGGPITGLMIGSTLGYVKNNEEIMETLTGTREKLSKARDYVKKRLPAMGLGAMAGALAGPFGITTNLVLGSAMGLAADTERFKQLIFGYKGLDGKRHGGAIDVFKKLMTPPIQALTNLIDKSKKFFNEEVINPLRKAIKPMFQEIENVFNKLGDMIADSISTHITKPIGNWITDKFLVPLEKKILLPLLKVPVRMGRRAIRTAISPFVRIGRGLERRQLKGIGTGGGTAADRAVRRQEYIDDYNDESSRVFDPLSKIPGIGKFLAKTPLTRTGRRARNAKRWEDAFNNSKGARFDEYALNKNTDNDEMNRALLLNRALQDSDKVKKNGIKAYADSILKSTHVDEVINSLIAQGKIPMAYHKVFINDIEKGEYKKSKDYIINRCPMFTDPVEQRALIKLIREAAEKVKKGIELANNAEEEARKFKELNGFDIRGRDVERALKAELKARGVTNADQEVTLQDIINEENQRREEETKEQNGGNASESFLEKATESIRDDVKIIADAFRRKHYTNHSGDQEQNEEFIKNMAMGRDPIHKPLLLTDNQYPDTALAVMPNVGTTAMVAIPGTEKTYAKYNTLDSEDDSTQYQYTEHGLIRFVRDDRGEMQVDSQDSETRMTIANQQEDQKTQKGILGKLSGIGSSLLDFFSGNKKEEKKPSIFSRILSVLGIGFNFLGGGTLTKALKIATGVAVGSYAWGKLSKEDENGVSMIDKIGSKINSVFGGVLDKLSSFWEETAKPFIFDDFIPNATDGFVDAVSSGVNLLVDKLPDILTTGITTLIDNLPNIIVGTFSVLGEVISGVIKNIFNTEETMDEIDITGDKNGYKNGQSADTLNIQKESDVVKNKVTKQYSTTKNIDGTVTTNRDIQAEIKSSYAYNNIGYDDKKEGTANNETIINAWDSPTIITDANGEAFTLGELANTPGVALMEDTNGNMLYSDDIFRNSSLLQLVTGNDTIEGADLGVEAFRDTEEARTKRTGTRASDHTLLKNKFVDAVINRKRNKNISLAYLNTAQKGINKLANVGEFISTNRLIRHIPFAKTVGRTMKAVAHVGALPTAALNFGSSFKSSIKSGNGILKATKGAFKDAASVMPFSDKTKKRASKVAALGSKLTNASKKAANKVTESAMKAAKISRVDTIEDIAGDVVSVTSSYKADSKIGKILLKIKDFFTDVFGSDKLLDTIYKKINKGVGEVNKLKEVPKAAIKTALSKLVDNIMAKLPATLASNITKLSANIAAVTATAGFSLAIKVAEGFLTGMKNADALFGVGFGNVSIKERIIGGLLGVIEEFTFGLIDAHTLMNWVLPFMQFLGLSDDDLEERQQQLETIVSNYNDEYGTNYTPYDFIMDDKIETKIMKGIVRAAKTAGSGLLTVGKGIATANYAIWGGIGNAVGSLFSDKYGWENYKENLGEMASSTAEQFTKTKQYARKPKSTREYFNEQMAELENPEEATQESVDNFKQYQIENQIKTAEDIATVPVSTMTNDGTTPIIEAAENQIITNLAIASGVTTDELLANEDTSIDGIGKETISNISTGWASLNNAFAPLVEIMNTKGEDMANLVSQNLAIAYGLADVGDNVTLKDILTDKKYIKLRQNIIKDNSIIAKIAGGITGSNSNNLAYQESAAIRKLNSTSSGTSTQKLANRLMADAGVFPVTIGGSGSGINDVGLKTNEDPSISTFVSQKTGKIANMTFGKGTLKQTVSEAGCAPTAAMMAINERIDKESAVGINEALKTAGGYMATTGGVTADYFADEFGKHGFKTAYVPKKDKNQKKILLHQLANGISVVLMGKDENNNSKKKSPFGPTYHYVVATGLSSDGKSVYINDPESNTPNQKYPVDTIFNNSDLSIIPIKTKGRIGSLAYNLKNKLKQFSGKAADGYIFVGDSRTVGLEAAIGKSDKKIFIAESGKGLVWLKNNIERVKKSARANPTYKIIVNMGVNDLGNITKYISYYQELLTSDLFKDNLYFMSVNPVNEDKYKKYAKNSRIHEFNDKYKAFAGDKYIDICTWMEEEGFEDRGDGLHYSVPQYKKIYNKVVEFFNDPSTLTTTDTDEITGTTKQAKSIRTIGDFISALGSILSGGYGLTTSEASDLTGDSNVDFDSTTDGTTTINTDGISGRVSSDTAVAKKQKELVAKMKSVEGKLKYAQNNAKYPGSRNPDDGSGDCSSTVQWAYKKVVGKDIGDWTGAQEDSKATEWIDEPHMTRQFDESKMQLGDILLYGNKARNHVEMYYGNGKMIGHGSGYGPKIKDITSRTKDPWSVKRLKDFMPGGKGSGIFVSQNDRKWANKSIGDETVAVAGCAPAVATMAINNTDEYNMKQAIKDAEKYKSPDKGGVSAEYFVDTFKKQGYDTMILKDKDQILNILAKGKNVILIGQDEKNKSKRKSPFGKGLHYVLANGVSQDKKTIIISDPELSEETTFKTDEVFRGVNLAIVPVSGKNGKVGKLSDALRDALGEMDGRGNSDLPTSNNPILVACAKMTRRLRSDAKGTWTYHNKGSKGKSWNDALKRKLYRTNCALFAIWALKDAGIMKENSKAFYGKSAKSDGWTWTDEVKKEVLQTCELIMVNGAKSASSMVKSGEIQPGDIISYSNYEHHTNIYAGDGNKWYDAGHVYCSGSGEGAVYKDWYGTQSNPGQVKSIIRYKGGARSSNALTIINRALDWAKTIADNKKYGYDSREGYNVGPDYSDSSFINEAFKQAGVNGLPESKTLTSDGIASAYEKLGFENITSSINFKKGTGLEKGDILINPGVQTEMYLGNNKMVGATGTATDGPENGETGDQTGKEIASVKYTNNPWKTALRYKGKSEDLSSTGLGSITYEDNAQSTVLDKLTNAFALLAEGWGLSSSTSDDSDTSSTTTDGDISGPTTDTGTSTPVKLTGTNDREKVWNYLRDKGVSEAGTAGLMGNFHAESGNRFNNLEDTINTYLNVSDAEYTKRVDNGTYNRQQFLHPKGGTAQYGYGLAQWTFEPRKAGLYDSAKSNNTSIADPKTQLDWLWHELNTDYKGVLNAVKDATSVQAASDKVLIDFEAPSGAESMKSLRGDYSKAIYNELAGKGSGLSAIGIPKSTKSTIKSINKLNKESNNKTKDIPFTNVYGKGSDINTSSYNKSSSALAVSTDVKKTTANNVSLETPTYAYTQNKSNNVVIAGSSNNKSSVDTTNTLLNAIVSLLTQEVKNTAFMEGIANAIVSLVDAKVEASEDVSTKKQLLDTKAQMLTLVRQQNSTATSTSLVDLINSMESIIVQ